MQGAAVGLLHRETWSFQFFTWQASYCPSPGRYKERAWGLAVLLFGDSTPTAHQTDRQNLQLPSWSPLVVVLLAKCLVNTNIAFNSA